MWNSRVRVPWVPMYRVPSSKMTCMTCIIFDRFRVHNRVTIFCICHSQTLAHSRVEFCEILFPWWSLATIKSRVPALHFLDPQRGYVTVHWLRIRVLSSPSEGRPLAAVNINDCWIPVVYWYSGTLAFLTRKHLLLELSEFELQVP